MTVIYFLLLVMHWHSCHDAPVRLQERAAMNGDLDSVLAKFRWYESEIRNLAAHDEKFRELCEDFTECLAAIKLFEQRGESSGQRYEEYIEFRAHLESELLRALQRHADKGRLSNNNK